MSRTSQANVRKMYAEVGAALGVTGRTINERANTTSRRLRIHRRRKRRSQLQAPELGVLVEISPYADTCWGITFCWNAGPNCAASLATFWRTPTSS